MRAASGHSMYARRRLVSRSPVIGEAATGRNRPFRSRQASALASRQSIGTKIVWRGLAPDDLVMWPLPVVSSTRTISPAPI